MSKTASYTAAERGRIGRNAGIVGITANVVLFILKVTVGIMSSSVSVIADAVNNLSDAGSSVIVMVSYILSGKPADKEHPYGHARMEYISTFIISLIITFLGFELFRSSVESVFSSEGTAEFETFSIVIMAVSMVIKLLLAMFFRRLGKKIDSASLSASAVDSLGDVAATAAVIAGMFLSKYTGSATDGVLGCIIAIYIFIMGIKLIKESADTLLGSAPDADTVSRVVKKLESYDGILGIHDLMMHNYGEGRFFASVHAEVDAAEDIMHSHDMIDNIERDFLSEFGLHMVIHLDPVCIGDERVDSLRILVLELLSVISEEYRQPVSMHDFRVVFGITHTNLIFDVVVPYGFPLNEKELEERIKEAVRGFEGNCFAVVTVEHDFTATFD